MRYMLISVYDREIATELFDSEKEAHDMMIQEMRETRGCPDDVDFTLDLVDNRDDIGFGRDWGWLNGKCDCDWKIVSIPTTDF